MSSRKRVAREAANLLHYGAKQEYKQAKLKAARTFKLHSMPTNLEADLSFGLLLLQNGTFLGFLGSQRKLKRLTCEASIRRI